MGCFFKSRKETDQKTSPVNFQYNIRYHFFTNKISDRRRILIKNLWKHNSGLCLLPFWPKVLNGLIIRHTPTTIKWTSAFPVHSFQLEEWDFYPPKQISPNKDFLSQFYRSGFMIFKVHRRKTEKEITLCCEQQIFFCYLFLPKYIVVPAHHDWHLHHIRSVWSRCGSTLDFWCIIFFMMSVYSQYKSMNTFTSW